MATYEYSCEYCGVIEILQKMSDDKLKICPKCGGYIKRMISKGTGFILNGKDWPGQEIRRKKDGVNESKTKD